MQRSDGGKYELYYDQSKNLTNIFICCSTKRFMHSCGEVNYSKIDDGFSTRIIDSDEEGIIII